MLKTSLKNISLITIFLFICIVLCKESENDDNDIFVATNEWKVIPKGQKIPKGLHVRINLETGLTEAKLLDETDNDKSKNRALSLSEQEKITEEKTISKSTLEEAMKNIKDDDILNPEEIKKIKDQFRSYEEIKKTLDQLNLTPKLDFEIMVELLKEYKEEFKQDKKDNIGLLKIIEDLDFLVHQYDNAREFVNQNGFEEIIYKSLNSTNSEVRKEILKLMASVVQNNVQPKIHALETGAIGIILRLINFDENLDVKVRAVSSLSALLRSFPAAQKKFIENGGFLVLGKLFESNDVKIQIKIATMISDLIVEHKWAFTDERLNKYYTSFDLTKHVLEHNWCESLNKLLISLVLLDKDDHDSIEKCLTAMFSLKEECSANYDKNLLTKLHKRYQELSYNDKDDNKTDEISDSSFFNGLKELCNEILHYVYKNSVKTEL